MGSVNERPHATAQGGLLRDALVSGLDGKERKVCTSRSGNIPEKLTSRINGVYLIGLHVKQTIVRHFPDGQSSEVTALVR